MLPSAFLRFCWTTLAKRFVGSLNLAAEIGGLLALRWRIYREETLHPEDRSELLPMAKLIEVRWTEIEAEHGEGSLLVEESETIQLCLSNPQPGSRHVTKPHLIENARHLRKIKGEAWWKQEHRLSSLAGLVGFENAQLDVVRGRGPF